MINESKILSNIKNCLTNKKPKPINKNYKENDNTLENRISKMEDKIKRIEKELSCVHPIEHILFLSNLPDYYNGCKRCALCGKILKKYYNKLDFLKDARANVQEKLHLKTKEYLNIIDNIDKQINSIENDIHV